MCIGIAHNIMWRAPAEDPGARLTGVSRPSRLHPCLPRASCGGNGGLFTCRTAAAFWGSHTEYCGQRCKTEKGERERESTVGVSHREVQAREAAATPHSRAPPRSACAPRDKVLSGSATQWHAEAEARSVRWTRAGPPGAGLVPTRGQGREDEETSSDSLGFNEICSRMTVQNPPAETRPVPPTHWRDCLGPWGSFQDSDQGGAPPFPVGSTDTRSGSGPHDYGGRPNPSRAPGLLGSHPGPSFVTATAVWILGSLCGAAAVIRPTNAFVFSPRGSGGAALHTDRPRAGFGTGLHGRKARVPGEPLAAPSPTPGARL